MAPVTAGAFIAAFQQARLVAWRSSFVKAVPGRGLIKSRVAEISRSQEKFKED